MDATHTLPLPEVIPLRDGQMRYWPGLLATPGDAWMSRLEQDIPWRHDRIRIAGQWRLIPRLQAWFGDPGAHYRYSGVSLDPLPWQPPLDELKTLAETLAGVPFNSLLLNLYRTGEDSMGWHADDERELGPSPIIASISFGSPRRFRLKHLREKHLTAELSLGHGDVLIMEGGMQSHWHHAIPKEKGVVTPRLNLTFRRIMTTGQHWQAQGETR